MVLVAASKYVWGLDPATSRSRFRPGIPALTQAASCSVVTKKREKDQGNLKDKPFNEMAIRLTQRFVSFSSFSTAILLIQKAQSHRMVYFSTSSIPEDKSPARGRRGVGLP